MSCGTLSTLSFILGRTDHDSYISSGDSTGSTPAQSEAAYDDIIRKHPVTILPLNHETYRKFMDNALNIWFHTDHLFLKKPLREYLLIIQINY